MVLLVLLSSSVCFGLVGCSQTGKPEAVNKKAENYITLIALGFADSATEQNKGLGFARYIKVNLDTDSVTSFLKYQVWDEADQITFRREKRAGVIKGLRAQPAIYGFLTKSVSLTNGKISPDIPNGTFYCGPIYLAVVKTDSSEKYFSFSKYNLNNIIASATDDLLKLPNHPRLKDIEPMMNEDSILAPLLTGQELSFLPPPPPVRNSIKFSPPAVNE